MKYKILLSFFAFFISCELCFAESLIVPTKYDDQEEILVQGNSLLRSNKENSILLYNTSDRIYCKRASFYFVASNYTNQPINLHFSNLKVTDQFGRPIKVIHKKRLLDEKESDRNWRMFGSLLCTVSDALHAQDAGKINYTSHTHGRSNSSGAIYGPRGSIRGSSSTSYSSTTHGTVHCEALRQQALRQVEVDTAMRNNAIENNYESWVYQISNFYFDSTTVFPETDYSSNFQIEVPKNIEAELEYLIISFDFGNETHSFCFYCGERVKKWYHF